MADEARQASIAQNKVDVEALNYHKAAAIRTWEKEQGQQQRWPPGAPAGSGRLLHAHQRAGEVLQQQQQQQLFLQRHQGEMPGAVEGGTGPGRWEDSMGARLGSEEEEEGGSSEDGAAQPLDLLPELPYAKGARRLPRKRPVRPVGIVT
ncbi:hypothetical protein DUNSADRAFT_3675 [Dunaliella salina]|uniref:Encoded protein n=1 Tax=Dunaliella salina TaxID=3046 RepID=A0ABQ7FV90_DUNSA|nr:hypothetical protein DUNSADRAFT_3675 [Dunaliella salina]|eukprot:KAF5826308.1 hypothetical protein DUNSADRAFT_3675 [Dunaliella salina]